MNIHKTLFLVVGLVASVALGQTAPAAEAAAAPPAPPAWYTKIKVEGMVDAYYSFRFQGTPSDKTNELRVFDTANNTFSVGFAKVAISMPAEPVGFRLDLGFGPVADATSSDFGTPAAEIIKHIEQAYASVKAGPVTIDAGKFVTSAGAEVIESSANWLQSRSMLFGFAIPFAHTGVRAALPIGDLFTLQASVVNGWDNLTVTQSWKTFNLSGTLTLPSATTIVLNLYAGPQATPSVKFLADLVVTQGIGDKVALTLNGDYGFEGAASWYGVNLMGKFMLADWCRLSARVEYFGDPQGARTAIAGSSYFTATVGAGFIIPGTAGFGNYEVRPELRHDQQLGGASSAYVGNTSTSQTTLSVAAVAWF